jgi:hypothetical protein
LAVTREQIEEYQLPTRPTKTTDSRAKHFMQQHGTDSVELDALPPTTLRSLVRDSIEEHMDPSKLHVLKLYEQQERAQLREVWGAAS